MKRVKKKKISASSHDDEIDFPDYPPYPGNEDIFSQYKEEDIDLDLYVKEIIDKPGKKIENDFVEDMAGNDLDVPGTELDDEQELIGSEDEENNYYSFGDNEEDVVEDKEI